jgi:hypothetical protein
MLATKLVSAAKMLVDPAQGTVGIQILEVSALADGHVDFAERGKRQAELVLAAADVRS